MRYYTVHTLSPHIQETPEGFLLCIGVPIARTGVQEYKPDEVPVAPGPSGLVLVVREEAEVFSPATIASFEGKSVTIDHPEDVNPDNWRDLTCGVAMNVRRGKGSEADLLLADLLITDAEGIAAVRERRLRQVSCGYDADYEEIRPGVGRQTNIIGNHIALVPHGRAGWRVGIKDALPTGAPSKETTMGKLETGKKTGFWDRFTGYLKAGKTTDEAAAAAVSDEAQSAQGSQEGAQQAADSGDAVAALTAKVEELTLLVRTLVEGKGTNDAPPPGSDDTGDAASKAAADGEQKKEGSGSAKTEDAMRARVADAAAVARAGAIYPGLAAREGDGLMAVQKASMRRAVQDEALKSVVEGFLAGRTLDDLSQVELDAVFCATAEVVKHVNNAKTADGLTRATVGDFGKPTTPEDVNAINKKFYDQKAG